MCDRLRDRTVAVPDCQAAPTLRRKLRMQRGADVSFAYTQYGTQEPGLTAGPDGRNDMPEPISFDNLIQIAGVRHTEEAQLLIDCGVRYLGFPLRLPVNEEGLSEKHAAAIIRAIRTSAWGAAITYQNDAVDIAGFMGEPGASIIQLHGDISAGELQRFRQLRPDIKVIKSLVVGERQHHDLLARAVFTVRSSMLSSRTPSILPPVPAVRPV